MVNNRKFERNKNMKNKIYVLALTALLGLGTITTVASCAGGGLGKVEADSIKFTKDAVTEIEVGETIDLAQFVKVSPEDCKWKVEAKTANIKVKGTKITGTAAGAFKVQITAGVDEMLKNYSGVVVSHELANLKKAAANLEKGNYTAALQNEDGLLSIAWHDSDYFGYLTFDDDENPIVDGLFTLKSGKTAEYTITGNWDLDETTMLPSGGKFAVEPTYCAPLDLYDFGAPIELEGDEFADNEDTPDVVMDADAFDNLAPILCGVDIASIEKGLSATVSTIYASADEAGNIKLELTTKSNKSICELDIINVGTTKIADVEDYAASGKEPEQLKFTAFESLMAEGLEKKNYTLNGAIEIGYYDANDVWHTTDNKTVLSSIYENWGELEPKTFTAYVDGETDYSIDNDTKAVSGHTVKDETFYYIDGTLGEDGTTYTWETEAGTSETVNSIWVNNLSMSNQGYTSHAAFAIGDYEPEMIASINWAAIETGKDGKITATATPYGDEGHALALGMALVPQLGNGYAWMMSTLSASAYPSAHWYDFFDRQEYVVDPSAKTVTINTTLQGLTSSGSTYYGVRFVVEIGSIGTSTLPTGYPDAAFVA